MSLILLVSNAKIKRIPARLIRVVPVFLVFPSKIGHTFVILPHTKLCSRGPAIEATIKFGTLWAL